MYATVICKAERDDGNQHVNPVFNCFTCMISPYTRSIASNGITNTGRSQNCINRYREYDTVKKNVISETVLRKEADFLSVITITYSINLSCRCNIIDNCIH